MKKHKAKNKQELEKMLDNAWFGIDLTDDELFDPMSQICGASSDGFLTRFTYLMGDPDYFYFVCKYILNVEILPLQSAILKELWERKSPMLIANRGLSKSFSLALYCMLRMLLMPGRKLVVVGAAFRQSKVIFEYMEGIWNNAPVLRDLCYGANSGPKKETDRFIMSIQGGQTLCLPLGTGQTIRGCRAHDILNDEFGSIPIDIFENVVGGFAAVSASPIEKVKLAAKKALAAQYGVELIDSSDSYAKSNQIILSGTASYEWNHFCKYWKRYKGIIDSKGDLEKLTQHLGYVPSPDFNWKDYSIIRIPVELAPPGLMDAGIIDRMKATVSSGIYMHEYGACVKSGTELVVDTGHKEIQDIEVGDMTLTHNGSFERVNKITKRWYKGKILKYKTFGHCNEIFVTPDHEYFVDNNWKEVQDCDYTNVCNLKVLNNQKELNISDYISVDYCDFGEYIYPKIRTKIMSQQDRDFIRNSNMSRKDLSILLDCSLSLIQRAKTSTYKPTKGKMPKKIPLDYNFGLIVGYYASEGSLGANGRATSFSLDGYRDKKIEYFIEELNNAILDVFEIVPKNYIKNGGSVVDVTINSTIFGSFISTVCPGIVDKKRVNPEILYSNEDFLRGFITGYWNGDGHLSLNHNTNITCSSVSKDLIYQVRTALSFFGIFGSITKIKNRTSVFRGKVYKNRQAYVINIYGSSRDVFRKTFYSHSSEANFRFNRRHIVPNENVTKLDIISKEMVDYDDYVYNIEVDNYPSYTISNATVHNCFSRDSMGFFKRSLIDGCTLSLDNPIILPSGEVMFVPMNKGNSNGKYVIAIDPASEVDNFSIVVLEIFPDHRRVVYCWTTNRQKHRNLMKSGMTHEDDFYGYCARKIRDLMAVFPTVEVAIDGQGGGIAVIEALHDRTKLLEGELQMWPKIIDGKEQSTDDFPGLHIIEVCQFGRYEWVSEANHGLRKDLEDKVLIFPFFDSATIGMAEMKDDEEGRIYDTNEDCIMEIEELKNELSMIIVTESPNGRARWDTPDGKSNNKKNKIRKDRYSALVMANMSARQIRFDVQPKYTGVRAGFAGRMIDKESGPLYVCPAWWEGAYK